MVDGDRLARWIIPIVGVVIVAGALLVGIAHP
jgi:hypothetical protein